MWNMSIDKRLWKKEWRIFAFERKCYRRNHANGMVSERELYTKVQTKRSDTEEIATIRAYMQNEWQLEDQMVVFLYCGRKIGWPHGEWVDDIVDLCRASLYELSHSAQERLKWRQIVEEKSDSNGRRARFMIMMMNNLVAIDWWPWRNTT